MLYACYEKKIITVWKLKQFQNWQFIHNCFKIIFHVQKIMLCKWPSLARQCVRQTTKSLFPDTYGPAYHSKSDWSIRFFKAILFLGMSWRHRNLWTNPNLNLANPICSPNLNLLEVNPNPRPTLKKRIAENLKLFQNISLRVI